MLGHELRKARLDADLTQEELAVRARLSREYISKLERNVQSPTVKTLLVLCKIMDLKASTVISRLERKAK